MTIKQTKLVTLSLATSQLSIFGIFHPFTSNFLIGNASKPTQQQKSHFEREEDF